MIDRIATYDGKTMLLTRLAIPALLVAAMMVLPPAASAQASLVEDESLRNWTAEEQAAEMEAMRQERAAMTEQDRMEAAHEWDDMLGEKPRWARGLSEDKQRELMMLPPTERAMFIFRERLERERGSRVDRALEHVFGTPKQLGLQERRRPRGVELAQNGGADASSGSGFYGGEMTIQRPPNADAGVGNNTGSQRETTRQQRRAQRQARQNGGADATANPGFNGDMRIQRPPNADVNGMSREDRQRYYQQRRAAMQDKWENMSESEREAFRQKQRERLASMDERKRAAIAARMQERFARMTPEEQEEFRQRFEAKLQGMSPDMQEKFRSLLPK